MNLLLLCVLCALRGELFIDEGYLGADVKDNASGQTVFSWFSPGPLDGAGLHSNAFDLHRPDVLKSVDGKVMNAEEFNAYIASLAPGAKVVIEYVKAVQRDTADIPGTVETVGDPQTITVVLESKEEYTGTIGRPRSITKEIEFTTLPLLDPFDPENVLGAAVAQHGLREEIETLIGVFHDTIEETTDAHMLSHVRATFREPFRLAEIQSSMNMTQPRMRWPEMFETKDLQLQEKPIEFARSLTGDLLGLRGVGGTFTGGGTGEATTTAGENLRDSIWWTDFWIDWSFGKTIFNLDESDPELKFPKTAHFAHECVSFLRVPRQTFYISGLDSKRHIGVARNSLAIQWDPMGNSLLDFEREVPPIDVETLRKSSVIDPPQGIRAFVEGKIIEAFESDSGWIVVGGNGPNSYDMTFVVGVYDIGGDDEYWASDLRIGTRAIIDLAGNDTYTGTPDQGPGGAILGVSFIDDRAGNDIYKGEMLSCGAAIYGISLLLDRGGNDTYSGTDWSMGAAVYGAGMLIDLGDGDDTYTGEFLCQGVGGPRGFGAIIDEGGDDKYMANGPQPSMYGDAGVFASFSQGVGFGYRGYAAGGIGMLSDLAGNDRYESGEFSQGGAYYFALGILHDAVGNDEYIGSRYSQGFGVHQAFGILADDAGDDVYKSAIAASQGAAWDIGAGLLIDRAGNDTYNCDGLGQGGASMQGIAMLVDLAGDDTYNATGGATQGESGGNSYHFAETGAFSFSLLWDEDGAKDFFSRGRENAKVTSTGVVNEQDAANSGAHGLVIDR